MDNGLTVSGHALDLLARMSDDGARLHPLDSVANADALVREGLALQVIVFVEGSDRLGYRRTDAGRAFIAKLRIRGEASHG